MDGTDWTGLEHSGLVLRRRDCGGGGLIPFFSLLDLFFFFLFASPRRGFLGSVGNDRDGCIEFPPWASVFLPFRCGHLGGLPCHTTVPDARFFWLFPGGMLQLRGLVIESKFSLELKHSLLAWDEPCSKGGKERSQGSNLWVFFFFLASDELKGALANCSRGERVTLHSTRMTNDDHDDHDSSDEGNENGEHSIFVRWR